MLQRVQCFLLLGVMASVSLHAQAPRRPPFGGGAFRVSGGVSRRGGHVDYEAAAEW